MDKSISRQANSCTVYFDGACPICRREIATYQKWRGASDITWLDASRCDEQVLGADLDRRSALARLHVRNAQGELVEGAAAFVELWAHLPALSWLVPFISSRPVIRILDLLYDVFLRIRPLWRRTGSK